LKYLFDDTDGIQCLAMSAPLPFKTNTDLHDQNRYCQVSKQQIHGGKKIIKVMIKKYDL